MTQRTILFRGKNQSGEWVYGSYVAGIFDDYGHIISNCTHSDYEHGELSLNGANVVSSSTVGQFTGQTDKNDKKIFEGDILKLADEELQVIYNEFYACFELMYKGGDSEPFNDTSNSPDESEVIGNIHTK
jgi:uncharacterized phage protein (TIGR01671 family)